MARQRRTFKDDFKIQVVKELLAYPGKVTALAKKFGISRFNIYQFKKDLEKKNLMPVNNTTSFRPNESAVKPNKLNSRNTEDSRDEEIKNLKVKLFDLMMELDQYRSSKNYSANVPVSRS